MNISDPIYFLIYLLFGALGIFVVKYIIEMLELPSRIRTIVLIIVALVVLLLVLRFANIL